MRFFPFVLLFFFGACSDSIPTEENATPIKDTTTATDNTNALTSAGTLSLGDSLILPLGENVVLKDEGISILLKEITADSRCPQQVNCVWAGEAKMNLQVVKAEQSETVELVAKGLCKEKKGACGNTTKALGYTIKLVNIYPYPVGKTPKTFEGYSAKILMSKNME